MIVHHFFKFAALVFLVINDRPNRTAYDTYGIQEWMSFPVSSAIAISTRSHVQRDGPIDRRYQSGTRVSLRIVRESKHSHSFFVLCRR